jgi:hypothetical protein
MTQVRIICNGRPSRAAANRGILITPGREKSLVEFPAPRESGAERERIWITNEDMHIAKPRSN